MQKVTDPPLKTCIKCGGAVTKIISAPAIQFKGSGWYITDYSNKQPAENKHKPQHKETKEIKKSEAAPPTKEEQSSSPTSK
jgi:predicted nucleic acid-binding Zn ribbon protein